LQEEYAYVINNLINCSAYISFRSIVKNNDDGEFMTGRITFGDPGQG